jgi:hypothetical protein
MHFAIDGTLWEGQSPDLYDKMAGLILGDLALKGHRFTFFGKTQLSMPPALVEAVYAPGGGLPALAPGSDSLTWQRVEEKMGDRLFKDGWARKSLPRALDAAVGMSWISWEGRDTGGEHPQWLFLRGFSELLWPGPGGFSPAAGRRFGARWKDLLQKRGTGVITFSAGAAGLLKEHFGAGGEALRVLPAFYPSGLSAASWEEKEQAKASYSGGQEYFLWIGSPAGESHWMEALKAFSMFKKGQRSHMQLLMAPWGNPGEGLPGSLASYKYRADVRIIDQGQADWQALFRSAYAVLYLPHFDELGWVPGMAAELEVPLISTWRSIAGDWARDSVLWVGPESPDSVADAMIRLYKDESFRGRLLDKGRSLAATRQGVSMLSQYEQVLTSTPAQ